MPNAPVSRRDRPAKPPLSRELIVSTGLRILDELGMDALTMRRVGQQLDTGAASLYVYVENRDDLLEAMLDAALAAVRLPARTTGTWQERLTIIVERTIEAMASHERLALVALGAIPSSPHALAILEGMAEVLKEASLDDATVSYSVDLLFLYSTAAAAERSAYREKLINRGSVDSYVQSIDAVYATLSADEFPHIVSLGKAMFAGGGDDRARWALQTLIAGILTNPAR